jgi:hypothetical protein
VSRFPFSGTKERIRRIKRIIANVVISSIEGVLTMKFDDGGPPGPTLTPAQSLAVAALAGGQTTTGAARVAGVSRQTVHSWRELAAFKAELNTLRAESIESARGGLLALADRAVKALGEMLDSPTTPPAIRLRTIELVLTNTMNETTGPTDVATIERDGRLLDRMTANLDRMLS